MSASARMLRYARRRAGLTQRALAGRAGIPQETVARIERDAISPRAETLQRLLLACGFGLEVAPRPGVGIDRSGIAQLLAVPPGERARIAAASDANMLAVTARARRL